MSSVKKLRPISLEIIDKDKAIAALEIEAYERSKKTDIIKPDNVDKSLKEFVWPSKVPHIIYQYKQPVVDTQENRIREQKREQKNRIREFEAKYHHSYVDIIVEIEKSYIHPRPLNFSAEDVYRNYVYGIKQIIQRSDNEPIKLDQYMKITNNTNPMSKDNNMEWVFKGFLYEVKGFYTDDERKLLILEDFDKERRFFEKLKSKFNSTNEAKSSYERPRIPESVRIEVWRRDGGKCAICGSREKLEYDHIVPISKGGSNTARNIELLCEKHNRSKSNNIV